MTTFTCSMHPEIQQNNAGDCPKCGMHLVPEESLHDSGAEHQACHHGDQPEAAVDTKDGRYDTVPAGDSGTVYTCPMHPEVRQTKPGSCPICGMGLELETANLTDEGPNPELVDFTRRMWIGAVLTIPLLVLTMGPVDCR